MKSLGQIESRPITGRFERGRLGSALAGGMVIGLGLLWRSKFLALGSFATKYGGDALWALLVFIGFGFLFSRFSTRRVAVISVGFAWAIEFLQLYHAPWIEFIRSSRLGLLIFGATFHIPDLLAYVVGILCGAGLEDGWHWVRRKKTSVSRKEAPGRVVTDSAG